jgi:hypothetical protein
VSAARQARRQQERAAALLPRSPAVPLPEHGLDPRVERALQTLDGPGWRNAIVRTNKLLTKSIQVIQDRNGDDMVMSNLFNQVFDLHAYALAAVAVEGLRAPLLIQIQTDKLSAHL